MKLVNKKYWIISGVILFYCAVVCGQVVLLLNNNPEYSSTIYNCVMMCILVYGLLFYRLKTSRFKK